MEKEVSYKIANGEWKEIFARLVAEGYSFKEQEFVYRGNEYVGEIVFRHVETMTGPEAIVTKDPKLEKLLQSISDTIKVQDRVHS